MPFEPFDEFYHYLALAKARIRTVPGPSPSLGPGSEFFLRELNS